MGRTYLLTAATVMFASCATGSGTGADDSGDTEVAVASATPIVAQGDAAERIVRASDAGTSDALLARYAPAPASNKTINYEIIDEALDLIVFNAGPSLRRRQRRPEAMAGSRLVRGHTSPYRLEGNKVFFSQFDDDAVAAVSEYRESLEAIGRTGRIQSLQRDEQLAYWYNLHNFVVIDEIAKAYPLRKPRSERIGPDDAPLHDAKVIDLGGDPLSLRDIREIVYTHWSDPKVMYGFYLGDLGGPSVRSEAYTGSGVSEDLDRQAREFVNSLRGVSQAGGRLYVSAFYEEGRPHYFTDWPDDLEAHLAEYADDAVMELLSEGREVRFAQYQDRIADMAGGEVVSDLANRGGVSPNSAIPPSMVRMVREYREKLQELREEGYLKPKVIIIDVPTDDPSDEVD